MAARVNYAPQSAREIPMNSFVHMKGVFLSLTCVLALALPVAAQKKLPVPPARARYTNTEAAVVRPPQLTIQTHTLANALTIEMVQDHHVPVVNLQVWYHVGSKDEKPGHTGFAHLFEHLMFKGSAHVGPDEHSRIIEAMGGFDNAYTDDDVTVFWETFPSNYLARVLWLEADRMGSLNVDEKNFKSERQVVEEERRLRVDNSPYGRAEEDLYAAAFTVHPYHHTTIGSIADLDKATVADVRAFHDIYYRPNNATLVISGDFAPAQALAWAEKYFGGIPRSPHPIPRVTVKEPPQTAERTVTKSYPGVPLPAIIEGCKMPARLSLESVGFGNFTEDPNLFWVLAVMNSGHTAEEGEKALDSVLAQMKSQPISQKQLEKAKNQQVSAFILGRETDQEKADAICEAAVIGKNPNLVNIGLARYEAVTAAAIQRVANEYFVPQHETVLFYLPQKQSKPAEGSKQ